MLEKRVSETCSVYCPIDGRCCVSQTQRLREYARWLEDLATKKDSMIFSNGGFNFCPGDCGTKKQRAAIVIQCQQNGLDPEIYLEKIKNRQR